MAWAPFSRLQLCCFACLCRPREAVERRLSMRWQENTCGTVLWEFCILFLQFLGRVRDTYGALIIALFQLLWVELPIRNVVIDN